MNLANVSQAIVLAKWAIFFDLSLIGGTIIICLWLLRTLAHAEVAPQTHRAQDPRPPPQRGARLRQIYPTKDDPEEDGPGPDIDIIAIHGLDTDSEKTWTWRGNGRKVNWLADPDMLPSRVKRVRIFTYDWPGDLLQPSDLVQKTQDEFAILLFQEIRSRIQITGDLATSEDRPILFIASCLGGIVLMKALVGAGTTYQSVRKATRGIVFLATPFRGTSFQDIAVLAESVLSARAWIRGREVVKLLTIAKEPTLDLVQLVQGFTSLCQDKDYPCQVSTFYEKGKTSLPSKVFPWLPAWLRQEKLLVNESSAALDMVPQPLPLSRPHILMNKFAHSNCTGECRKDCTESEDFGRVSGKIVEMLQKIREGSPAQQADAWIRTEHYTPDKLGIERLSGKVLPMDQCYINLAIVEEPRKPAQHAEDRSGENASPYTSPFSLTARLNVETPDEKKQMELPSLFDQPKDSNNKPIKPRTRIFIRGRAGVGKTTLCKKMVSGFLTDEFRKWNALFDRVLWVPLRRLKEWSPPQYDLEELFSHEFFATENRRKTRAAFAKELVSELGKKRTLFILDGVDEISQELTHDNYKSAFLKELLNQPNAVITSRPHVSLPANVSPPDLELETIGFYPDQVKAYLQATFADLKKVEHIQSYLEAHQLIQGLVRIPIQLDALCYTWDNFNSKAVPQTMTTIYKAIEESLWKKDVLRLEKKDDGELLTKDVIKYEKMDQIENFVGDEVFLLQGLAFTGLRNDVISFGLEHRKAMSKEFTLSNKSVYWDRTFPRLSFLRTSDPSEEDHNRDYYFLHLTFQEYFAARYFVRQWKTKQHLNCLQFTKGGEAKIESSIETDPNTFLQEHKYDPRYDIFWRFVAGLLNADGKALGFFQAIEKEPRDVLGPTHQRLVMHCLSEVERKETTFMEFRTKLEKTLEQWLLFECDSTQNCWLACEIECPEQVIVNALKQASKDARLILLKSLKRRAAVPSSVIEVVIPWLEDCASKKLSIAILGIVKHQHKALPNTTLQRIAAQLEDEDGYVRQAAVDALQGQANLKDEMLQRIGARLEDEDGSVRQAVVEALQGQANLTNEMLQRIAARLEHKDWDVRRAAVKALQGQANLTDEVLQRIAARLKDEYWQVQQVAVKALQGQANLTDEVLQRIAARLEDEEWDVRQAAVEALQGQANLKDEMLQRIGARLEDEDGSVRQAVVEALQGQANLTDEVLQRIAARLEHKDGYVRQAAVEALQGQANLTDEVLQRIAARLKDEYWQVRRAAVKALQGQANLTDEMLQRIGARLEDEDGSVRQAAVEALQGQANLTDEVLQRIAARLKDEYWQVRWAAVKALQGQANLIDEMLQRIAARLEDKDGYVRQAAVEALQGQANLTDEVLQRIAARLEHEERDVRRAAVEALQGQANLTDEVLQRIAARLEDEDGQVQQAAVKALQGQANLTDEMLQRIAARLEHEEWDVRQSAVEVLQGQANLIDEMLQRIAARLEDEDRDVQQAAVKALQGQANLTDEVLQRIAARLEDEDGQVQQAAVKALQGQANLTDEVLQRIAARLEHEEWDVRQAAVEALQGQANLIDEMLQRIAARLEDEDGDVQQAAVEALQGQANLTDEVLQRIAARLEDEEWDVRQAAVEILINQAALSLEALSLYIKPLYNALLQKSFKEHIYWYGLDKAFVGVGLRRILLNCKQEHESSEEIWKIRNNLGIPLSTS